jgi:cell pole-organizing protein PopZ
MIQALSERQQASERQLSEMSAVIKAIEARMAELGRPAASGSATAAAKASPAAPAAAAKPVKAAITPEILVLLAAAATSYLGKQVRVRTAKMLQSPYEIVNPWSQQGRAFIQASHFIRR